MPFYNVQKMIRFENAVVEFLKKHQIEKIVEEFDFEGKARVYIGSGLMFNDLGNIGTQLIADVCEAVNLPYYLPNYIEGDCDIEKDNEELENCNIMLSHLTLPEEGSLNAKCGRFNHMREVYPTRHYANVAFFDDVRKTTDLGILHRNNGVQLTPYMADVPDYFGENLYDCFRFMHLAYLRNSQNIH